MSVPKKYALSAAHIQAYWSYHDMRDRCESPSNEHYARNLAKGVTVCPQWKKNFLQFFADMGPPPAKGYTIDRMDNNKGYQPGNCRWATRVEQDKNRPGNINITHNGLTMHLAEWSRHLGGCADLVCKRLEIGWTKIEAVSHRKGERRT